MILELYVRNYYEVHGTFDKILLSPVSDVLRKYATDYKCTVNEACYSLLGTPEVKGFTYSEVFKYAVLCAQGNLEDVPEEVLRALEKPIGIFKKNLNTKKYTEEQLQIIDVVRLYFLCTSDDLVKIEDKSYRMTDAISVIRNLHSANKNVGAFIKDNCTKLSVISGEHTVVSVGKLVTAYSGKDIAKLIQTGLAYAVLGDHMKGNYLIRHLNSLMFLSQIDMEAYFITQVMATATGHTYKELLQSIGVNIQDQTKYVRMLGCMFWLVGNKVYFAEDDVEQPISLMGISNYYRMLENGGFR